MGAGNAILAPKSSPSPKQCHSARRSKRWRAFLCLMDSMEPQPEITEHAETFLRGVVFCCALALMGCVVAYIIQQLQ